MPPMIPSRRSGGYIRISQNGIDSTSTARAGLRSGGNYPEEGQEGEEGAGAGGRRAGDARQAGREGQGLRRPRVRLQGRRLQEARIQSRPQGPQRRIALG